MGSRPSPPALGKSSLSGPTPGQTPAASTASRMSASICRMSSGRSASSPAYLPSSPGRLRLPMRLRTPQMSGTDHA
eukprot:5508463-Lingulodinium_polyedra.AAC.1